MLFGKCAYGFTSGEFDEYKKFYAYHGGHYNYSLSTMALKNLQKLSAKTNGP